MIKNNLPNRGMCPCGHPYDNNGICTNPNCPTAEAYTNGFRAELLTSKYEIDDGD